MCKFIIILQLLPGARDEILARVPEVRAATRAAPRCTAYDFLTCSDDPDRPVFESFRSKEAHEWHLEQDHTKAFITLHVLKHLSSVSKP